ncbi:DUF1206 domain-containing protein [cf. Phormidesmis sp. LEGE 11477]|uniref:DUF1206 domain-containing protein n=1 Tax=cf. Phormidesmis sp. LEGE 11477 TaxID=1828680 RepID=UPI001882B3C5|nr:DUF1206 domain-containing protein [cf. Phormidesmis sp. LEGE 11477]MBE9061814.1 DUF1206 domain-containing protein [cf. Phormidesmis sp. LEGE 11477]
MTKAETNERLVRKWVSSYARFGYGAKGIIYGGTGLLALSEAFDLTDEGVASSTGVLKAIGIQPLGKVLVVLIAFGLMGYVLWRLIQAGWDPEHSGGKGFPDIVRRIGYGCSGLVYASIAYSVVEILTEQPSEAKKSLEDWAYEIMARPIGRLLVGVVGLVFFCIGCYYFYRAIKAEFRKRFKRHHMSDAAKTWASIMGRVGIAARGVVYVLIGAYAVGAAWQFEPAMIKTTEEALALFDDNPTDEWILAILGIGFVAYAIHMGFQAVYRSIEPID